MPRSKTRKKKTSPVSAKKNRHAHQDHADWHAERRQRQASTFVPNMRTKQNANWEKRS